MSSQSGEGSLCSSEGQKLSNLMRSYAISINRVDKREGELWLSLSVTPGQVISTLLLPTNADMLEYVSVCLYFHFSFTCIVILSDIHGGWDFHYQPLLGYVTTVKFESRSMTLIYPVEI